MNMDNDSLVNLLGKLHTTLEERAGAISKLQTLEPKSTMQQLFKLFTAVDDEVVCDAAHMIMVIDSRHGVDLILPLLLNASGTVRWCVCTLLHDYVTGYDSSDGKFAKALTTRLLTDPQDNVRLVSAKALGRIKDAATLPALQHGADNDKGADWEGRTVADAARKAIERITSPPKARWS